MKDVIVVGGGPGGYAAALRASQMGGKVVLVEAAEIGGTCVNRGCIPTKTWSHAASILRSIRVAADFGIKTSIQGVDIQTIVNRKNGVAAEIRLGMEGILNSNGVQMIKGRATLKSPHEAGVDGTIIQGKRIILATGSLIHMPDLPGPGEAVLTTDQVLDMAEIPSSVLIWGGGPIEVEIATFLSILGCKVYLATEHRRLLPREDHGTSQRIAQALREQGVEVFRSTSPRSLQKSGETYHCTLSGSEDKTVNVAKVVVCSRKPNTANIGVEDLGIRLHEDSSIWIDERLETSVAGIYAIGDVTGGWMLSQAASAMGIKAAENAMGKTSTFPFQLIPRGIWTSPEVGAVGLSEAEAEKTGRDVKVGSFPYAINGLAMAQNQVMGAVKVIADSRRGEILGVHIVGSNATELVGEAVMAMQLESTVRELANSIRVHPTFSEAVVEAARDASSQALYLPKR
jgi:dihydrolipoamide dehydrogenase